MQAKPKVIAVMGPTAAGKTALAIDLVERFDAEIISVDSAQVYRGLDIGSAKPSAAELERAPHRLIDLRDPWQRYSAAEFAADATAAIGTIFAAGRVPLLVGGTMLYFKALFDGLSPLPAGDAQIRAQLATRAEQLGWPALHQELAAVDPAAAARIQPTDPQRIQRALEVFQLTGRAISELQAIPGEPALAAEILKIVVSPADRAVLHRRIERRFVAMLDAGLIDEVATLRNDPRVDPDSPALKAVGYRQVWAYLAGQYNRDELVRRGVAATRQLAKRQLTWLRKQTDALWFDPTLADWRQRATERIAQYLA